MLKEMLFDTRACHVLSPKITLLWSSRLLIETSFAKSAKNTK